MDVSWSRHLAPLCGGWVLTHPKTLMMIKLTVGEQTKVMFLLESQLHSNIRGWGVQWNDYGGRCGICGDAWGDFPREHEAPLGWFCFSWTFYVLLQIRQICDGNFSAPLHIRLLGARHSGYHNQPWWIFCFQGHTLKICHDIYSLDLLLPYSGVK